MQPLKIGIVGLSSEYRPYVDYLTRCSEYQIVAVGDLDRELAEEVARDLEVTGYDDFRMLIVQEKIQALALLLPAYACQECMTLASRQPFHVFRSSPIGRTALETSQWVTAMARAGCQFHVAAPWRFNPAHKRAQQTIDAGQIGRIYLIRAESFGHISSNPGYRGDPILAGGGVLMDLGYPLIDQIIQVAGRPEEVFCQHSSFCSKRCLPPLMTEDTALLTMVYDNGTTAEIVCSWMSGPPRSRITFYGTEGIIELEGASFWLKDIDGICEDEFHGEGDFAQYVQWQYRNFIDCVQGEPQNPVSPAADHLAVVAIIELAYLSARTQSPESLKTYADLFNI